MNVNYFKQFWKSSLMVIMLCFGLTSWGQETLTINRSSFPSGSGYTNSTWSATATTGETITGQANIFLTTVGNIQIGGTQTPHPYNSVEIPGVITKITITMPGSGSLRAWTPRVSASSALTSASGGTALNTQTFTSNSGTLTWNLDASDNYKYFYLQAGGNTNIASIVIEYQVAAPTYSITYNGNDFDGGSAPVDSNEYEESEPATVLANTFTKEGYHFTGWNTQIDGSGISYVADDTFNMPANDVTLYAQWAINTYTVTYNGNGNTGGDVPVDGDSPYNHGSDVTVLGHGDLTLTDHSFLSWNTQADGLGTAYLTGSIISNITSDITLYAQWLDDSLEPQTITFEPLANVTYGDAAFNLTATSDSGLAVSYASSNENVATIDGNTVTIVGVGTTDITASQLGDEINYQPAVPVVQTLTVNQKNLTISGVIVEDKPYDGTTNATIDASDATLNGVVGTDDVDFATGTGEFVSADAGSDIAVTLTSNFTLTGTAAGNYTLTQPALTGNILKAEQTVTLSDLNAYLGDEAITLPTVTDQEIAIEYISNNESVATVEGNVLTIVGLGTTEIFAGNSGNTNYNAFTGGFEITVTEAPEEYAGVGVFEKITSLDDLTDGYYVIARGTRGMSNSHTTSSGGNILSEDITITDNSITDPSINIVWKIETNGSGKVLYNEAIDQYVSSTSNSSNNIGLSPTVTDTERFTPSIVSDYFRFTNVGHSSRVLQRNTGTTGSFRWYGTSSNQYDLELYKLIPPSTDPLLTVSETEITGLDYIAGDGPSASQSFTVSGVNLEGSAITVTAPDNFEVSTDDETFGGSANLSSTDGTLGETPVYVRLMAGLTANTYDGNIAISGGTAPEVTVAVSGEVIDYCMPTSEANDESGITSVSFADINNTSVGDPLYSDFTDITAHVIAGNSYDLIVGVNTFEENTYIVKAWIDWNKNYIFDAGEQYNVGNAFNNGTTSPFSITIPVDTEVGEYRMRIRTMWEPSGILTACGEIDYTETEDYTITVIPTPSFSLSVNSIAGFTYVAGSGPSNSDSFTVSGVNLDGSAITVTAPENFEISTDDETFSDSVNLSSTDGTLAETTVYVRLVTGLTAATYSGDITISGGTAPEVTVAVSGEVTCVAATYSFATATESKTTDDEAFTNAFTTNNTSATVFASSNPAVATVHPATGEVSIVGAGTATINVTQEADGTYCAVSTSYELNVTTLEPLLVFSGNTDMGSTCFQGEAIEAEYTVTNNGGSTANNVVFLNTNPAFQVFPPVSPQNIAPGGFVTFAVTFNPMMGALPNTNNNTLTAMSNGETLASHNITATVIMPMNGDVATYAATNETETGVTFNGQITDLGTCWNVTEYGFVYATTPNPTNANFSIIAGTNPSFATPFQFTLGGVLTPGTTYYYKAYVKYSQGFADYYHYGNEESFITTLSTPTATAATNVSSNSFTANWNAVAGATSYEINVWTYETGGYATDLFISEYVEGSSNNKAIEIFNGTAATVNLNDYKVILYANGSTSATNTQVLGDLQATLLPGQTIVLRNSSLNVPGYISSVCNFNGDDAIGLYKGEDLIDVFGKIGDDPGNAWTGSNSYTTVDKTLRRKSSVTEGITTNPSGTGATAFTTLTTEWDMFNIDTYDGLGTHTFNGGSTQVFILQNENVGNVTSYEVTGLDSETTYKYTVKAQTADTATVSSNEISVTTLATPIVTWTTENEWSNVYGPTGNDDVVIEGDLVVGTGGFGSFTAKTLTVNGSITIEANNYVIVEGKITNNGEFVVESDGILYQNNYTGANEGAITVKRAANPMKRLDYTLWSSPVSGMPLNQFSNISNNGGTGTIWNRVYELGADAWNSIWSSYAEASESTATFADAKGYLYRAFNSYNAVNTTIFTGEFTGVPNNGTKSISTPNAFDAVGNPYPSPIYADDFITSNNADAIYFWTNVNSSNGTEYVHNNWASYTLAGGVGVAIGGDSENIDPDTIPADDMHIQPGQGFVVYTVENSVSFDNSMRINSNGQFFRAMNDERSRFWLNLSNEEVTFNQILVGYMDNATQGVDTGIDGKMFAYEGNALYSIIENNADNYVIQGRSLPFTASDVVALGFRAVNAGSFTISLHNFDGLFADNQNIYLKDNFTQAVHNLKDGAYSFVSEEGVFNTRFEVVYQTTMSVENPVANNSNWVVYSQENGFQVQTQGFELKTVQVFDLLGRTVYTANAQGTTHNIPSLGAESVYIVKVTTTDNVVLSKKVK